VREGLKANQRDCHSSETKGNLKADLNPPQLENEAIAVPKGGHLAAADESSADASISTGYRFGAPQIPRGAGEVRRRDPAGRPRSHRPPSDTSCRVRATLRRRPDANDETCLDDVQTDPAGRLRARWRASLQHYHPRRHDSRGKFHSASGAKRYRLPILTLARRDSMRRRNIDATRRGLHHTRKLR
jgi:hypothetical protein